MSLLPKVSQEADQSQSMALSLIMHNAHTGHKAAVWCVALNMKSKRAVSGSGDRIVSQPSGISMAHTHVNVPMRWSVWGLNVHLICQLLLVSSVFRLLVVCMRVVGSSLF